MNKNEKSENKVQKSAPTPQAEDNGVNTSLPSHESSQEKPDLVKEIVPDLKKELNSILADLKDEDPKPC